MQTWRALAIALSAVAGLWGCQRAAGDPQGDGPGGAAGVGPMSRTLKGEIYLLPDGQTQLPDFRGLRPIGAVYVRQLNAADRNWRAGLSGHSGWLAIDFNGQFWVSRAARYDFTLTSDGASRLLIDGKAVVDTDGGRAASGEAALSGGAHHLEVRYVQGPGERVALQLACHRPGQAPAVFPHCGLPLKAPGLSVVWLAWLTVLAAVGAVALWLVARRVRVEAQGAPAHKPLDP